MYNEKSIINQATISAFLISLAMIFIEFLLLVIGGVNNATAITLVDSAIKLIAGCIGLALQKKYYGYSIKDFFTEKIHKATWLVIIPFYVFFLTYLTLIPMVNSITGKNTVLFLQQALGLVSSAFYVQTVCIGIVVAACMGRLNEKGIRIRGVLLCGVAYALAALCDLILGKSYLECLSNAIIMFSLGLFFGAVFMVSGNLLFMIILHSLYLLVPAILNDFFIFSKFTDLADKADVLRRIIIIFVLSISGIVIPLIYDKLPGKTSN